MALLLGAGLRTLLLSAERRHVNDAEEKGLPKLGRERAWTLSEHTQKSDALDGMDGGEYAEQGATELSDRARFDRGEE